MGRCDGWRVYVAGRMSAMMVCGVLLASVLAGCGTSAQAGRGGRIASPTTTSTPKAESNASPTSCINRTPGPTPPPAPPAPTPIVPGGWSTVTNATYHYTIRYPSNWYVVRGGPVGNQGTDFAIVNWDPAQYHPFTPDAPTPPYTKIGVEAFAVPSPQSPADFYSSQQNGASVPLCSRTTQQTTIAGRAALEVVQWPTPDTGFGAINYPQVTYDVADGVAASTTWMFDVYEAYSPNGQPSAIFAQMLASLTFTG